MNTQLYLLDTNAGRDVVLSIHGHWYCCDCVPDGMFGTVDICKWEDEEIAAKIAGGISNGDIIDLADMATGAVQGEYGFGEELTDIRGCTVDDLDRLDNYETNSFGDLVPKNHDTSTYTLIAEQDIGLGYFADYWEE